jgi:branched-subunit amino acid transport protein
MQIDWNIYLLIFGMTLVTAWSRSFFLILGEREKVSDWVLEAIRFAPMAAMVAILAPEIFLPASATSVAQFDLRLPNIWGGLAAFIAFYLSRKMIITLVVGMTAFTIARFWLQ